MSEEIKLEFTAHQISDWHEYEEVRQSGAFNMLDPRARRATGLSEAEYSFVLRNYSALKQSALAKAEVKA